MKIKVVFNEVIRRWRSSEDDISFDTLVAFVKKNWGNGLPDTMGLTFVDEEGDQITITNDADLEEALTIAREDCRTSLKISVIDLLDAPAAGFVVLGSEPSLSEESDDYDEEITEATQPEKAKPDLEAEQEMATITKTSEAPKPEVQPEPEPKVTVEPTAEPVAEEPEIKVDDEKTEPEETEPETDWKELAKSFFEDKIVEEALPGVIDVLFNALKGGDDLNVAIDLALASYPVVHEHPLVQKGLPFLPAYLPRLVPAIPFFLLLGPEAAKAQIGALREMATKMMCNPDIHNGGELDITPILSGCCPQLIKLMNSGLANGEEQTVDVGTLLSRFGLGMPDLEGRAAAENTRREEEEARKNGPTIHRGVTCDGCGKSPIEGARFKSAVIPDFDLCGDCAEKGVDQHPPEYPMIKFNTSMQDMQKLNMRMAGLREFMGQFHRGQGRHRGGRGRGRGRCGRGRGGHRDWRRWANNADSDWARDRMSQWDNQSTPSGAGCMPKWGGYSCEEWKAWKSQWTPEEWAAWKAKKAERWGHGGGHGGCPWKKNWRAAAPSSAAPQTPGWARFPKDTQTQPEPQAPKNKAQFLADVTIPDRSICAPGQMLIKTWKMRNSGKAAWENCYLQFVKGSKQLIPNGVPALRSYPVAKVLAGQTTDISAHIQTPTVPGRYTSYFRLSDAFGNRFGPKIWVDLIVENQDADALQKAIDASLKTDQVKKVHKASKKVQKLDGLQRKLARKLERLEKKNSKIEAKLEKNAKKNEGNTDEEKYNKYVNKLEQKLAATESKQQHLQRRLSDAKAERAAHASVVENTTAEPQAPTIIEHIMDGISTADNYLQRQLSTKEAQDMKHEIIKGVTRVENFVSRQLEDVDVGKAQKDIVSTIKTGLNQADQFIQEKFATGKNTMVEEPQCSIVQEPQVPVAEAVKALSPHAQPIDDQKVEIPAMPTEEPEPFDDNASAFTQPPSAPPKPAFKYQDAFNQVQGMGFSSNPEVIRYLLTENKGDVTKTINHLLSQA